MTKIFLDTNVILDLIIPGREGKDTARSILDLQAASEDSVRLYLSVLSVANIAYVLRKHCEKKQTQELIRDLFHSCCILGMPDMSVYDALRSKCPDFEDALQISCAEGADCDFLLTSNTQHFLGYTWLTVLSPAQFLAGLKESGSVVMD